MLFKRTRAPRRAQRKRRLVTAQVVDAGSFDEFKVGTRRYGVFLRVQRALVVHARARLRGVAAHRGGAFTFADQERGRAVRAEPRPNVRAPRPRPRRVSAE